MTRSEAVDLLRMHVHSDSLWKHSLATEAVMRGLAERFGEENAEAWGVIGLLHDLDFDYTRDDPEAHGRKSVELLASVRLPGEALDAILRHNAEALGLERETRLDFALTCAETVTGLIVAAALVHPDKKLESLKPQSVRKRMKSKDFARNVSRDHIMLCERIGIPLLDFIELGLAAMTAVSDDLGL
ncbi:MAG: HD domain-containing protein [Syntrophobacteraceae bacterium]